MSAVVALPVLQAVPAPAGSHVAVKGELNHRCPFVHEADYGTVTIRWTTTEVTVELHSLRAWLDTWSAREISHEALVQAVAAAIAGTGVTDVAVEATYETAGMEVTVGAVPGESITRGGG